MATSLPPGAPRAGHRRGTRGRRRGSDDGEQIFVDTSGRRKQWTRRAVLLLCIPLIAYLGLLATGAVSSSPLGTPPWVAEQPQKPEEDKPQEGTGASQQPTATGKPGKATKTPRPTGAAPAARTPAGGDATSPTATAGAGGTGPAPAPGAASTGATPTAVPTSSQPGNAPPEPPGQTRRPTSANTNKGGH